MEFSENVLLIKWVLTSSECNLIILPYVSRNPSGYIWAFFVKGSDMGRFTIVALLVIAAAAMAAERVVLFEEFTQTG